MPTAEIKPELKLQNILVATDFSDAQTPAFLYATEFARSHRSDVVLVHAIQPEPVSGVPLDPDHELDSQLITQAERKMATIVADRIFSGIPHHEVVRQGFVWDVVSAVAREHSADLIVLATHGRTGVKHLVMGSVAEQIFRIAACPVMTIGPHARPATNIERVLYATDFSPSAERALPYAIVMARESQAALIALHVADFAYSEGVDLSPQMMASAEKRLQLKVPQPADFTDFHYIVKLGLPAFDGILTAAAEHNVDLIVMGLNRHSIVSTHLPWATAHQVVAHARCPVLTVR